MRRQTKRAGAVDKWWLDTGGPPAAMGDPGPGAFESASLAIHVVNAEGLIVDTNRAFELMFGASQRLYLGKHHAILGADPIAAGLRLLDRIRSGITPRGVWRGTMRNERFNGAVFTTRADVYPMRLGGRAYLVFFQEEERAAITTRVPIANLSRPQLLAAPS